ncbi:MAG TPA: hypothetical protein PKY96_15630 [Flavobacteriales bacterium]|nr:hypothetical protein [Flavobacteriales bacterium]
MKKLALIAACASLVACGRVAEGTKSALNKGGEFAGAAATEVVEGMASGVEKTWSIDVALSEELKASGISLGKTMVEEDSAGADNVLVLYVIASKEFNSPVTAIAIDKDGREYGRAGAEVALAANGADYFTLRFQSRTDLERKSRVVLQ